MQREEDKRGAGKFPRRKIAMEYVKDKTRRNAIFAKRKSGLMKKAYELTTMTGSELLLLMASENGHVYTFATPKFQPIITEPQNKMLIQALLNVEDSSDLLSYLPGMPNSRSVDGALSHPLHTPFQQALHPLLQFQQQSQGPGLSSGHQAQSALSAAPHLSVHPSLQTHAQSVDWTLGNSEHSFVGPVGGAASGGASVDAAAPGSAPTDASDSTAFAPSSAGDGTLRALASAMFSPGSAASGSQI